MPVKHSGFITSLLLLLSVWTRAAVAGRDVLPVLEFPEQGIDDTAAYRGYMTRFFRDGGNRVATAPDAVRELIRPFLDPYPVGLFVPEIGPLVANDAYAGKDVWEGFRRDEYHSPRVVWGREVNLFLLGLARLALDAEKGGEGTG